MKNTSTTICRALALALALMLSGGASFAGAPTIALTPQSGGMFFLQGADMAGVAAMDITLNYDANALGDPRVEQGELISGAMMAVNPNMPGVVRVAIIRLTPITGSGSILSLTFGRFSESSNPVTGLSVKLTDINGLPLPVQAQIVNPPAATASAGEQQTASQATAPQSAAAAAPQVTQAVPQLIAPGVVVPLSESRTSQQEQQPATIREMAPPMQEPTIAKADETARRGPERSSGPAPNKKAVFTQKSALDLFKEYKGPRTPQAFMALFMQDPLIGCSQDPSPALADGKTTVKVTFIAPADLKGTPDIALIGATLASLERDRENTNSWIALVRPHRNVIEAKITISFTDTAVVIPLAVAPRVDIAAKKSGKVTEKDFELYLKGTGEKKRSGRDLNGDRNVNYLDDYIFTANYLENIKAEHRPASSK